jgi:hypothetical protein
VAPAELYASIFDLLSPIFYLLSSIYCFLASDRFAAANRSVFFRRAARFLVFVLPWLCPIIRNGRAYSTVSPSISCMVDDDNAAVFVPFSLFI